MGRIPGRHAVAMDLRGGGFELGSAGRYLPDFRINGQAFLEAKPTPNAVYEEDRERYFALYHYTGDPVWLVIGTPGEHTIVVTGLPDISGSQGQWAECRWCGAPAVLALADHTVWSTACALECQTSEIEYLLHELRVAGGFVDGDPLVKLAERLRSATLTPIVPAARIDAAISAARGARFEFGESGAGGG
jgi:hypothetical protein